MEVLEFAPLRIDSQTHPASQWPNLPVTMGVLYCVICMAVPPIVDLHLIKKNQVQQTGFLVYFDLDLYCLCSLQKSSSK